MNASEDAYLSGLRWREEKPSLPSNYEMAKEEAAIPREEV